jgi:hypothetical protein
MRSSGVLWFVVSLTVPTLVLEAEGASREQAASAPQAAGQETPKKKDDHSHPAHGKAEPATGEKGIIPKAIPIPGTDLTLTIGGYAKVDFIQDFSGIGNAFDFQTNSIPAEGTSAAEESGRTTIHARETRVSLDLRATEKGPQGKFRVFVEGDFYGDGNAFRLRHAFGEFAGLLGGQTWSTFQDISARPLTIDFEGPDGEVFVRQAMIRYTHALSPQWSWAVAVENPSPQFSVPSSLQGVARSSAPDFPAFVRYQTKRGHAQVAGILRQLRFAGGQGVSNASEVGWGVNSSLSVKTFGQDELQGMFVIGDGVARYIESLGGQNVDGVLTADGELTTLRSRAFVLGHTHHWLKNLRSGLSYSSSDVEGIPAEAGTAIEGTTDVRGNLIWTPYHLVDIGGEVLWGRRENQNGTSGDAWRGQFALIFHFN